MADDDQPETQTLPKTGARIPVPKRKDVMDALRKAGEPVEPDEDAPIVDEDSV